jgi:hypothetical protein
MPKPLAFETLLYLELWGKAFSFVVGVINADAILDPLVHFVGAV